MGGGLLGYIAGEMAVGDPVIAPWIAANASGLVAIVPFLGFATVVAAAGLLARRRRGADGC